MNKAPSPERVFGDREWAGYLLARNYSLLHLGDPLTPNFIIDLHVMLSYRTNPHMAGVLNRPGGLRRGLLKAVPNAQNILTLQDDPWLAYELASSQADFKAAIVYPPFTDDEMYEQLEIFCEWYDNNLDAYTPVGLAARLQRTLVRLHPFHAGFNGRLSRLLMNWTLATVGLGPSAPPDFDNDIFFTDPEWVHEVHVGREIYRSYIDRLLRGETDPSVFLGVKRTEEGVLAAQHVLDTVIDGSKYHLRNRERFNNSV